MAERPEDLNLPIAVITRLVKEALPDGVNVSKEARTAISKAASVFVLYATSCANNFALKAKRKTLTGQDVLSAMADMDFEKFVEPLQESLEVFRKEQKDRRDLLEKKKKDKSEDDIKSLEASKSLEDDAGDVGCGDPDEEEEENDDNKEENGNEGEVEKIEDDEDDD